MRAIFRVAGIKIRAALKNGAWPEEYTTRYLEPGICSYKDAGQGVVMVSGETIEKMAPSFVGKPVYVLHPDEDATPENFKKLKPVGVVTRWQREWDGWFSCNFILDNEEAKKKIAEGYQVSCAYDVTGVGPGGSWHAIKYDRSVTDGVMQHLALVPNPRYEDVGVPRKVLVNSMEAEIQSAREETKVGDVVTLGGREVKVAELLENSVVFEDKNGARVEVARRPVQHKKEESKVYKFFTKKNEKIEAVETVDLDQTTVDVDGKPVALSAILNASAKVRAAVAKVKPAQAPTVDLEDEFQIGEEKFSMKNAVDEYRQEMLELARKNAASDTEDELKNGRKCSCNAAEDMDHEDDCRMSAKNGGPGGKKAKKNAAKEAAPATRATFAQNNALREHAEPTGPGVGSGMMTEKLARGKALC